MPAQEFGKRDEITNGSEVKASNPTLRETPQWIKDIAHIGLGSEDSDSPQPEPPASPAPSLDPSVPWIDRVLSRPGLETLIPPKGGHGEDRADMVPTLGSEHLFSTLEAEGLIRSITYHFDAASQIFYGVFDVSEEVCGYRRLVHGGLTAAISDQCFGGMVLCLKKQGALKPGVAYTASLEVDYRKPVPSNSRLVAAVHLDRIEGDGRKIFMSCVLTGPKGPGLEGEAAYLWSKCLFVHPAQSIKVATESSDSTAPAPSSAPAPAPATSRPPPAPEPAWLCELGARQPGGAGATWLEAVTSGKEIVSVTNMGEMIDPGQNFHHGEDHFLTALSSEGLLVSFEYFFDRRREVFIGSYQVGEDVCGWPKLLHGGLTATVADQSFGNLVFALKEAGVLPGGPCYTARLEVDYKRPIPANSKIVALAKVDRVEGRKVWMTCMLTGEEGPGAEGRQVYAKARALFIHPKPQVWNPSSWFVLLPWSVCKAVWSVQRVVERGMEVVGALGHMIGF